MTIWLPQLRRERPLYLEIADAIRHDALSGALKPGDRLPPQRDLAYRLGVTTGTVTRAYAEAEKMGLVAGEVGRGSFVKAPGAQARAYEIPSPSKSGIIDLSQASPPRIHALQDLDTALRQIMASPSRLDLLDYTPAEGHPLHRAMGVTWLARCGIHVKEEDVVVTAGAHAALIACLSAIAGPGDRMFVEGLNYPTIKPIARHLGVTLVPLEMDLGGLVPEALERAARAGEARLLYIVPTLQNPTTSSLNHDRRAAVIDIARRYGLTLIEDDIFRLLDPRTQPPTLFSLAPDRTWHITSISKSLSPGLRVGFVATPPGRARQLIRHQTVASGRAVGLAAEVARHWIEGDTADRVLSAIIAENQARRALALEALRGREVHCAPYAPFLWLKLPESWTPGDFARALDGRGIHVTPGTAFAIDRRSDDQGVRICFGGPVTREELRQALASIDALLDEDPTERLNPVA
ncbi:PLP-dependent aminotransferase family protein [Aestuariivirga sp.]|uniref:aminotransferase-like domain-containing protein n=1 Tax=Aestuariivirga sp. TaxID=2650926 RepID=UPI00391AC713